MNKSLAQRNKSPSGRKATKKRSDQNQGEYCETSVGIADGHATVVLANCAGRDPQPIATVQPTDANATCAMIVAEIKANNIKVKELAGEEGGKVAQNVVAGVAGVFIPVLWFGMDFKGAASKEVAALQARQQYLTTLATERCAQRGRR